MRQLRLHTDELASAAPPMAGGWGLPWRPPRGAHVWRLKRNCALRPGQYLAAMGLLMGISALVAIACWIRGIWLVPVFCCIELTAVSAAALAYARHAIDGETVVLVGNREVRVDVDRGLRHDRYVLPAQGLRLIRDEDGALYLRQGGTRLQVGAHAPAAVREAFAADLRDMLAGRWEPRPQA